MQETFYILENIYNWRRNIIMATIADKIKEFKDKHKMVYSSETKASCESLHKNPYPVPQRDTLGRGYYKKDEQILSKLK